MVDKEQVVLSLLELHKWRQIFNDSEFGLGFDQYKPKNEFHYAEAYALWGSGYVLLADLTNDPSYLDYAIQCAQWLTENTNQNYHYPSWGLPWSWDTWKTPPNLSYLITTVFAGELFLSLVKKTGDKKFLCIAKNIASWIIQENGGIENEDGLCLYYANFPVLKFPVINPTAKACGFFADLYTQTGDANFFQNYLKTASWVYKLQNPDGSWWYSNQSSKIDCVHTGFTLEGLSIAYNLLINKKWEPFLEKGYDYYWNTFFDKSGFAREVAYKSKKPNQLLFGNNLYKSISSVIFRKRFETRLWGYGSALRSFVIASIFEEKWLSSSKTIFEYIQKYLRNNDGSYAYHRYDRRAFIRHQAHIFNALAFFGSRLDNL